MVSLRYSAPHAIPALAAPCSDHRSRKPSGCRRMKQHGRRCRSRLVPRSRDLPAATMCCPAPPCRAAEDVLCPAALPVGASHPAEQPAVPCSTSGPVAHTRAKPPNSGRCRRVWCTPATSHVSQLVESVKTQTQSSSRHHSVPRRTGRTASRRCTERRVSCRWMGAAAFAVSSCLELLYLTLRQWL